MLELMVVVAIIAVVGIVVGPGFKKAYDDYKIKETIEQVLVLESACRSYYLIYNEFPRDTGAKQIDKKLAEFVPSSYYKKELTGNDFYFNITPWGDAFYDVDNWVGQTWIGASPYFVVSIGFSTSKSRERFKSYFLKLHPNYDLYIWNKYGSYWFSVYFNEMRNFTENENRYH